MVRLLCCGVDVCEAGVVVVEVVGGPTRALFVGGWLSPMVRLLRCGVDVCEAGVVVVGVVGGSTRALFVGGWLSWLAAVVAGVPVPLMVSPGMCWCGTDSAGRISRRRTVGEPLVVQGLDTVACPIGCAVTGGCGSMATGRCV